MKPPRTFLLSAAGYTNTFQMVSDRQNDRRGPLTDNKHTHTEMCGAFAIARSRKRTFKAQTNTAQRSHANRNTPACWSSPHAPQTQSATSVTSACLGGNRSGNSNYIIERTAVRETLLITQCFQHPASGSATH